jgi:hypothetical protein
MKIFQKYARRTVGGSHRPWRRDLEYVSISTSIQGGEEDTDRITSYDLSFLRAADDRVPKRRQWHGA